MCFNEIGLYKQRADFIKLFLHLTQIKINSRGTPVSKCHKWNYKFYFVYKFNNLNLFLSAGEPPAVVEHLKPITCGLKKPATLTCRISGQPPPTIKWLVKLHPNSCFFFTYFIVAIKKTITNYTKVFKITANIFYKLC